VDDGTFLQGSRDRHKPIVRVAQRVFANDDALVNPNTLQATDMQAQEQRHAEAEQLRQMWVAGPTTLQQWANSLQVERNGLGQFFQGHPRDHWMDETRFND
jgi:hypothetical protein